MVWYSPLCFGRWWRQGIAENLRVGAEQRGERGVVWRALSGEFFVALAFGIFYVRVGFSWWVLAFALVPVLKWWCGQRTREMVVIELGYRVVAVLVLRITGRCCVRRK
jgi:hypothetical protein